LRQLNIPKIDTWIRWKTRFDKVDWV